MLTKRDKDILIYLEKHKAITIMQSYRIFFNDCKFGYDVARKRLKKLEDMEVLKSYKNQLTDEKIYYTEQKISAHDLYVLDFYSLLVFNNCKNIEFKIQPRYLKDMIRPDAFFKFEFNGNLYFILLEVDLTHSSMPKMQTYERLYRSQELQEQCYGTFPLIVIMGTHNIKYESTNFDIIYSDFKLSNFTHNVLGFN
ncbi:MAG: hypothetical protein ABF633_01605 [Clostridium sp.]|uniref:hypothetical protein n=1 Tax=Clostridium sp. TaxID=1506 RepID=UPI0039EC2520